jgi:transcriptional regulator NrdR family protein
MRCDRCGNAQTNVVVVVHSQDVIIRRRHCYHCSHDFNTVELSKERGLAGVGDPQLRAELMALAEESPAPARQARG